MAKDREHIETFVRHIFNNDFASARSSLQAVVTEKVKGLIRRETVATAKTR